MANMQGLSIAEMWKRVSYLRMLDILNNISGKLLLACFLILLSLKSNGESPRDSLKQLLNDKNLANRSEVLLNLFVRYRTIDFDSARYYAEESLKEAKIDKDSLMVVRAEYALGYLLSNNGFFIEAIEHFNRALKTAKNNNYRRRLKSTLNSLALTHYYEGSYDKSLEYHFESLKLREEDNNQQEIAIAANNIGLVYYQMQDFDKARLYYDRALDIKQSLNASGTESTYNNLGLAYQGLGNYPKALENFEKVIEICQVGCNDDLLVVAYTGAGAAYYNLNNSKEAENLYELALILALKNNFEMRTVTIYSNWARLLLDQEELDEAREYLDESQSIADKISLRKWQSLNAKLYAELFSKLGDFEKAYSFQQQYDSISKSIINETIARNMLDIQVDYQEKENLEKIASQDQEISRRNTLLYLSVVIIILISIILFILYRINQLRRKTNRELAEAKRTIEQQNNVLEEKVRERTKELKEANAALMKSNTDLDNFIYKTSHDIRGPLATLQGMCNVALIDINDQKSRDYFDKIGKTAFRLNEILSKLLIINQINNSLIAQNPIDLQGLSKEIVREQSFISGQNDIKVENKIGKLDNFQSDEVLLKIILGNMVSNAFKFHNSSNRVNSWVRLEAHRENGHLKLNVIDNGIGVDEKASSKIFEIFSRASEVSDTAGLGLYLVKLAVEKLHGKITHSKTDEGYTKFTVELPSN